MLEKQQRQNGKNEKEKKKPREKQSIKKKVKYFFSSHGQNNVIFNSLKLQGVDLRWHLTATSATKINGREQIQTITNIKWVN